MAFAITGLTIRRPAALEMCLGDYAFSECIFSCDEGIGDLFCAFRLTVLLTAASRIPLWPA
jgi:hypothetical protein